MKDHSKDVHEDQVVDPVNTVEGAGEATPEDATTDQAISPAGGAVEDAAESTLQDMVRAFSSPAKGATGTFESQLSPEEIDSLTAFVAWLRTEDPQGIKTDNTSNSYRSYVAQALVHFKNGGRREDLSTDVRSGVNAFSRFLAST